MDIRAFQGGTLGDLLRATKGGGQMPEGWAGLPYERVPGGDRPLMPPDEAQAQPVGPGVPVEGGDWRVPPSGGGGWRPLPPNEGFPAGDGSPFRSDLIERIGQPGNAQMFTPAEQQARQAAQAFAQPSAPASASAYQQPQPQRPMAGISTRRQPQTLGMMLWPGYYGSAPQQPSGYPYRQSASGDIGHMRNGNWGGMVR
jgi:hypothetical protein